MSASQTENLSTKAAEMPHQNDPAAPSPPVRDLGSMTQWQLIRRRFAKHRLAVASCYILVALYLMALFAEFVAPYSAQQRHLDHQLAPPQPISFSLQNGLYTSGLVGRLNPIDGTTIYERDPGDVIPIRFFVRGDQRLWGLIPINRQLLGVDYERYRDLHPASERAPTMFLLGSDRYGRDLLSRIIFGARISLSIGLIAIAISFVVGIIVGGISGYYGGFADVVIQRIIEILQSIPGLPLWIALGAVLPAYWSDLKVYFGITVVLSLLGWTGLARTVRSKLLSLREEDYAVAARLLGAGNGRIIFRHLLPGFTSHIIVVLSLSVPAMILGETALSFLGLGLRPPVVSWGVLLQDCLDVDMLARSPWLIMPTTFIVATVLAFNFIGDGLRDAADPYR